jgi:protein ImuB
MTDWMIRKQPELKDIPFAMACNEKGRRVVKSVNAVAHEKGIYVDMVVADCTALAPELKIYEYNPLEEQKLLKDLSEWCLRFTPIVAIYESNVLILDAGGCTHLWGNDQLYVKEIHKRFSSIGYSVRLAMADTVGCAWAICHYGKNGSVVSLKAHLPSIFHMPPASLRIEKCVCDKLEKLGLKTVGDFINMPRTALRRRFGQGLLSRIDQALGFEIEMITPIKPPAVYEERLPSLEPIRTASGIEIAIKAMLEKMCSRLCKEGKGLRSCQLRCYRVDGNVQTINIGTHKPSRNALHLFQLFEIKIPHIQPDLGIELFILEVPIVEDLVPPQDSMWTTSYVNETAVAELMDKLAGKIGSQAIHRFLPSENYWPEMSVKNSTSLTEKPSTKWRNDLPRPLHLLSKPEPIEVSVPVPDYPPLLFRYLGALHTVKKADGPERIEQEWWIQEGLYRDYYCVEDEQGARYWLFRSGNYESSNAEWFIHGFFA